MKCCGNCEYFKEFKKPKKKGNGRCRRFPIHQDKNERNLPCGEHKLVIDPEVLITDLMMLQLSDKTRALCRKLHCHTVGDIKMLGRIAFAASGSAYALLAISEIDIAMKRLDLEW